MVHKQINFFVGINSTFFTSLHLWYAHGIVSPIISLQHFFFSFTFFERFHFDEWKWHPTEKEKIKERKRWNERYTETLNDEKHGPDLYAIWQYTIFSVPIISASFFFFFNFQNCFVHCLKNRRDTLQVVRRDESPNEKINKRPICIIYIFRSLFFFSRSRRKQTNLAFSQSIIIRMILFWIYFFLFHSYLIFFVKKNGAFRGFYFIALSIVLCSFIALLSHWAWS